MMPYRPASLNKNVMLVIFSYMTTNQIFIRGSKLSKVFRGIMVENKESQVLNLDTLVIKTPKDCSIFDYSYMIDFAPYIHLISASPVQDQVKKLANRFETALLVTKVFESRSSQLKELTIDGEFNVDCLL
jgi:hypothetical protein